MRRCRVRSPPLRLLLRGGGVGAARGLGGARRAARIAARPRLAAAGARQPAVPATTRPAWPLREEAGLGRARPKSAGIGGAGGQHAGAHSTCLGIDRGRGDLCTVCVFPNTVCTSRLTQWWALADEPCTQARGNLPLGCVQVITLPSVSSKRSGFAGSGAYSW